MEVAKKNIQIQKWVAIISVFMLLTKALAYYLTHSVAILTDALEGIVNIISGFVGLYSLNLSAKPRDDDHPYGHGKIEFVSALLEGSLIIIAAAVIIYHAIKNIIVPASLQQLDLGMFLICITAVINFAMGYICLRIGNKNKSVALIASGKHLQSDTYTTVGIVVGLIIVYFTGIVLFDSIVAILFALLIVRTGFTILRTSLAGILDATDNTLLIQLVDVLNKHRSINWIDVHNLRIIKYGNVLHIDCHLTVPWYFNIHEAHLEIDELTKVVRDHFGDALEFYIHTDGCLEFSCKICNKTDCPVRQHPAEKQIHWTVNNIATNTKHSVDTFA